MPSYAKLCQAMPSYAKLCQAMPSYAKLCQAMPIPHTPAYLFHTSFVHLFVHMSFRLSILSSVHPSYPSVF
jgi:hypothetical protein